MGSRSIAGMEEQQAVMLRWQRAIDAGDIGIWDLRPKLETVHHSPQWKRRLGFPAPQAADDTHFWRCRVHPDDLEPMLVAMRPHLWGGAPADQPIYQATFRLRSNGSGYRTVHSRGRVLERDPDGRAARMVGTMVDLTERPWTPRDGLPDSPEGLGAGRRLAAPFHRLLLPDAQWPADQQAAMLLERDRLLPLVADMLNAALERLDAAL